MGQTTEMTQFERSRATMIDNQLRTSGVTDWRVLAQMAIVPRERFVPADRQSIAYIDDVHWFGQGASRRFIMAPATLAKLLQLAEIDDTDEVLDIGPATGYSTAVIAGLSASVTGLEADVELAAAARSNLDALAIRNASIVAGTIAALGRRTFDVIIVQGALDRVPDVMFAALKDGGRLIALISTGGVSIANVFVKTGTAVAARGEFNATLPRLDQAVPATEFVF